MEGLFHAVVGDLTKIGEGRFGGYGAEVRVRVERLEELRGTHGFAEAEGAARMILRLQEVEPLVNVVALEKSLGGERAAAGAVSAGVGEEHGESVGEEELGVSGHADAVVAKAVEENNGVSVWVMGAEGPGAKRDGVGRCDGDVGGIGVESLSGLADRGGFFVGEWAASRVESAVGDDDAPDYAEDEIQE